MRIGRKVLVGIAIILGISSLLLQFKISTSKPAEPQSISTPTSAPTSIPTSTLTPTPTKIIPTQIISPKPTANTSKPQTLDDLFIKYGAIYNVNPDVLKKIAECESGFDVNQITGDYAGLFQFASFAWREARGRIGLPDDLNLRFNAEESIRTAAFEINYKGTSGWDDCD